MTGLTRDDMANRLAQDIPNGSYVNLGIGIPELVTKFVPIDCEFIYHTENGLLGMGPSPEEGGGDPELINAGKRRVTALPGAAYFHHADSFSMIRGGHLDLCVLGALQVSKNGDLANWSTGAPDAIPAVGGGKATAGKADTISRYALVSLLQHISDEPVSIINVTAMARELGVTASTIVGAADVIDSLTIRTKGEHEHAIEGTVHADGLPRVTNIEGRRFDMVPTGHMIALFNNDTPGMVGRVGEVLGAAKVNIDEMVIGHGDDDGVAMMIIKANTVPSEDLLEQLSTIDGVSKVAAAEVN
jgi:3-oxoacid CoA-transferase B subunit